MRGVKWSKYEVGQKDVKYENMLSEARGTQGTKSQFFWHSQGSQQDQERCDHDFVFSLSLWLQVKGNDLKYTGWPETCLGEEQ